ncbi:MAG: ubiquinol oxidase subunit II [Caulobacteraceae bacterium]|nr:ubiquinol oxidase subunit II [Caulobacteraceae bacterium]
MREHLSHVRRLGRLAPLLTLGLLAGCERAVLNPAGDIALQQRNLIYISTGLMLLIIVPVIVLIVLFAWRYRAGNRKATYDPKFDHSTGLELVIWSVPLLIIICLGALTWSNTHLLDPFRRLDRIGPGKPADAAEAPMVVQVVAMDWKWLFIYPRENIATVNELVLPVDREVRFDITSTNMMNTFYAPTLAGMIYAMPGMQSQLHAVLNRPGDYEGFSGNYSGAGFSDMRFRLRGVSPAQYDQWVRQAQDTGTALTTESYLALEKPTERHPVTYFSSTPHGLFDRVVNRCVAPGTTCIADQMRHHGAAQAARPGERGPHGEAHAPAPSARTAPVTGHGPSN